VIGGPVAAASYVVAACLLALWAPRRAGRRVRGIVRPAPVSRSARRRVPIGGAAVLAGVAAWAVVGGFLGGLVGVVITVAVDVALHRLEPSSTRRERDAAALALPLAAELIASAVEAGCPPPRAVRAVSEAVGGPLGRRLGQVAAALLLDVDPSEAWGPLADLPGAMPIIQAAVRSSSSGAGWAPSIRRAVVAMRTTAASVEDAAGQRAAVLVVLPVGLCFLPAFVAIGIVPLVVGVLGAVLR
jgi:pilus assembly protein TadC